MVNILVTGGAGFIGSHLVASLLQRGDSVRVLDNFSTGKRENLTGLNGVEVLEGDLRDPDVISSAIRDVELVFHQAAFVSPQQSMLEPQTCFGINVHGTGLLLEAARKAKVRRVVLASSAAVYGENVNLPLAEDAELMPRSPYAASKIANEIYAGLYSRSMDLEVVALRYFNVYGPRQSLESQYAAAIPIFINQILAGEPVTIFGDGNQTRDLVFVDDVVRANLVAADDPGIAGQVFNICSGTEISIQELLTRLEQIIGSSVERQYEPPRPGDIYRSIGNPEKATKLIGFRVQTNLAEGLKQTMEGMYPQ